MALKSIRSLLTLVLGLAALLALPAVRAYAADGGLPDTTFPTLAKFASSISNGQASQLRGVYVPKILADSVVQQPANQSDFVSAEPDVLTQFRAASSLGSTGLLAHDFLAGAKFVQMQYGQMIYLVYGDGRTVAYVVVHALQYQALQPESVYSNFIDLRSGRLMTSGNVFSIAYARPGSVIFQTCIAVNGISSWGRLFVIAEPYAARGHMR
jgi:hypothetical protein